MPDFITNVLDVTGDAKDVEALRNKVYRFETATDQGSIGEMFPVFDFNGTVPLPAEIKDTTCPCPKEEKELQAELTKKYGAGNWYDWSLKFWGVKWNSGHCYEVEEIEDGLRFRFDTAWSPPAQWIYTTAQQFPSLKFVDHWINEGGGCGRLTVYCENGEVLADNEEISDHDFRIEFDNNYRDEYELITEGKYKDVLAEYSKMTEPNYSSLNPFLLKRLKDEDLPLFLNFEWDDLRDEFESRFKSGGKLQLIIKK
jgi:hypothetical protein